MLSSPRRGQGGRRAALVVALGAVPLLLTACGTVPVPAAGGATTPAPAASGSAAPGPVDTVEPDGTGPSDGACEYTVTGTAARPVRPPTTSDVATSGTVSYVVHLTEGDVTLRLDRAAAPCTVHSFESLVAQRYYDGTRCHRLTDSVVFFLQCGDPTAKGSGGPGYTFPDETDGTERYRRGTVAMANRGANTNGSQFFLVWDDSDLPSRSTVFGSFDERSREVVAAVASQGQDGSDPAGGGVPNSPAAVESITKAS